MPGSNADSAELFFRKTDVPKGFTHESLSKLDGSPEPVIRELIQNSVDAADKADRPCEVVFKICTVSLKDLPGWDAYEQAFKDAEAERENRSRPQTPDEKKIISRIREVMSEPKVRLLLCSDNGIGISPDRMESLLTPGNSDKGEGGAGSFGLGHYAAFAASNLRYLLYASRYRNGDRDIETIFTGHAILATRTNKEEKAIQSADGFLFKDGQGELAFIGDFNPYSKIVSPVLEEAMDNLDDTGTVVCITGFNEFNRSADDPTTVDAIAQVAAANFCHAIFTRRLTIQVEAEDQSEALSIDHYNLEEILQPLAHIRRAPKQGQIRGNDAYRSYETLVRGQQVTHEIGNGVSLHVRMLGEEGRPSTTRVHLFRKGMWIKSDRTVPGLQGNDLAGTNSFDAVLALQCGDLETLVRDAEGPAHRGLETKRLLREEDKKRLKEKLQQVVTVLRDTAGEQSLEDEIVLHNFATLSGEGVRKAEKRGRFSGGGGGKRKGQTLQGEKPGGGKSKRPRPRKRGTIRSGSYPIHAYSMRAEPDTRTIEVDFELREVLPSGTLLGIRLAEVSGSDFSCYPQIVPNFLPLLSIRTSEGEVAISSEDDYWTILATNNPQQWEIELVDPVTQPQKLELIVVKLKPAASDRGKSTDVNTSESRSVK